MTEEQEWAKRAEMMGVTVAEAKAVAESIAAGKLALTQGPAPPEQRNRFVDHCLRIASDVAGEPVRLRQGGDVVTEAGDQDVAAFTKPAPGYLRFCMKAQQ